MQDMTAREAVTQEGSNGPGSGAGSPSASVLDAHTSAVNADHSIAEHSFSKLLQRHHTPGGTSYSHDIADMSFTSAQDITGFILFTR